MFTQTTFRFRTLLAMFAAVGIAISSVVSVSAQETTTVEGDLIPVRVSPTQSNIQLATYETEKETTVSYRVELFRGAIAEVDQIFTSAFEEHESVDGSSENPMSISFQPEKNLSRLSFSKRAEFRESLEKMRLSKGQTLKSVSDKPVEFFSGTMVPRISGGTNGKLQAEVIQIGTKVEFSHRLTKKSQIITALNITQTAINPAESITIAFDKHGNKIECPQILETERNTTLKCNPEDSLVCSICVRSHEDDSAETVVLILTPHFESAQDAVSKATEK